MKKLLNSVFFILLVTSSYSQNQLTMPTEIKAVTVYLKGALVTRSGEIQIAQGRQVILIKNLTPSMDAKSIQVKSGSNVGVLSVKHQIDVTESKGKSKSIDSLNALKARLDLLSKKLTARKEVIHEKTTLLTANRSFGSNISAVTPDQLKAALELFDKEFMKAKTELLTLQASLDSIVIVQNTIVHAINRIVGEPTGTRSQVIIEVMSASPTKAHFDISYLVQNAAWFPKYDIRVRDINSPTELVYKADVYQHTGEDWKNVKLKFSNGSPNERQTAPKLNPWKLNFSRYTTVITPQISDAALGGKVITGKVMDANRDPLIGASVVIKGTTAGTTTDFNGFFSLSLPFGAQQLIITYTGYESQVIPINSDYVEAILNTGAVLETAVVTGMAITREKKDISYSISTLSGSISNPKPAPQTVVYENQLNVEFEIELLYTIFSDGKITNVEIIRYNLSSDYTYEAAPKLVPGAYLVATVTDWDKFHLLQGEANLFVSNTYIGRTFLNPEIITDTLAISLGRDPEIILARTKVDELSKRKFLGANVIADKNFKITIRNKKMFPVHLIVSDQIPVSVAENIMVNSNDLSGGILDANTGIIKWDVIVPAGESIDLNFGYTVKYPSKERIPLE